ncbi:E3 ubiquitin-protein ligase TRIM71-like [Ylistrum balloti]|uniref:E3 ubiquitin-protein ligase TRIM71-like n=1 Tax=Ylistrum balloti TaxID=509963 RepID=UPI002905CB6F|nr:E3 ubiquitin-protein ligase TRIM71-like [Ylistrum balloti]
MAGRQEGKRALSSLLKNTRCYLCRNDFTDPRELNCYHVFCKSCLDGYINTVCPEGTIECPLCDEATPTPRRGAEGLKKNLYLNLSTISVGIICDVCNNDQNAIGRCIECSQDLCESCFNYHNNIRSTREHHVATIDKDHLQGKLTRDVYCEIHVNEKNMYYCIDCEKLVCQHCNMTKHKLHLCRVVTEMSDNFREQLTDLVESEEFANHLFWMTDRKTETVQHIKKLEGLEEVAAREIINHAKVWHELIEDMKKFMLKRAREEARKGISPAKNIGKKLENNMQSYANLYLVARAAVKQSDDVEIVESGLKLQRKLRSLRIEGPVRTLSKNSGIQFSPKVMSLEEFNPMFGLVGPTVQLDSNSRLISAFCIKTAGAPVSSISYATDGRSWIIEGIDGLIQLYDNRGRVHQTINLGLPADDIICEPDNKKYVSCNSAKQVVTLDENLQMSVVTKTDLCTRGIAYDRQQGALVICLTEKNAFYDYEHHHKNRIVKTIVNGEKRMETPDILSFAASPLVEYPARLTATKSGFIAISDWKRNCVTILDATGHVETEYFILSKGANSEGFCPRGICCDNDGRILVADFNNHRIMLLDETGQTFLAILTKEDGIHHPWSVSCGNDGLVWIGNKHGEVKIYHINFAESTK